MKIISTIKSNKVFKTSTILSVCLLVVIVSIFIVGHFIAVNVIQEKSSIIDVSDPITEERYNRLMADSKKFKEDMEALKSIRISKDSVVLLVQYFDDIALKTGLKQTVGIVTGEGNKNKKDYSIPTVRYEINVAGGSLAIDEYMTRLIDAPFFLRVESVEIAAPDENSPTGDYLATIFVAVAIKE